MKGGIYFHVHAPTGQAYGIIAHPFAHTRAQTAQDTVIFLLFKARLLEIIFFRQFPYDGHIRTPGQQQLHNELTALVHGVGIRKDLHPFPYRVVACGHKAGSAPIKKLYRAKTAHAGRFEGFMIAKGGDLHSISLGNLEDMLPLFSLDLFTVKLERDHRDYSFTLMLFHNNGIKLTGIVADAALDALFLI
jgi:hypothetical protein